MMYHILNCHKNINGDPNTTVYEKKGSCRVVYCSAHGSNFHENYAIMMKKQNLVSI